MPNRKPLSLWIVVSMFLAAVTAVPLTCRLRSRTTPPPTVTELGTLTELAEVLSQDAPDLQIVPMAKYGSVETGMYLCKEPCSWEQLLRLSRSDKEADKWQGIVYCEGERGNLSILENEVQMWGENAMRVEPFLFFGDPDLLRRIDQIIRNHSKR